MRSTASVCGHGRRAASVVATLGAVLAGAGVAAGQPCQIAPPPGAVFEQEGCVPDLTPCAQLVFPTVQCGVPLVGRGSFEGFTRDTDWFQFTITEPRNVSLTVASEFDALVGFMATSTPNPTGACSEFTGFVDPFVNATGSCSATSIVANLGAGTWTVFVSAAFGSTVVCSSGSAEYLLTVTCGGDLPVDCNGNGMNDADEIMANPALDCFNPLVLTNPGTTGGPDGFMDLCQCQANWNRDVDVNSTDISGFLVSWLSDIGGGPASADFNCDGQSNSSDISAYLGLWLSAVQNTIPNDGCP